MQFRTGEDRLQLTSSEIRELVINGVPVTFPSSREITKPLIEPVTRKRLEFIEGGAFDLTLAEVYQPNNSLYCPILGEDSRFIPEVEKASSFYRASRQSPSRGSYVLRSGKSYLFQSRETVNIPSWLSARVQPRTTLLRSFCQVTCAEVHPNYQGVITILVTVNHPRGLLISRFSRFCFLKFETFGPGKNDSYSGIWSGKKAVTEGTERAF